MQQYMAGKWMRFFFLFVAMVMCAGIYLTGISQVHWLLYAAALFFSFAAITGICPGFIISRMLFAKDNFTTVSS